MDLQRIGTSYGGWYVDLDKIPIGSTILDLGIGEDISFSAELLRLKDIIVIAVDPTMKSQLFMSRFNSDRYTYISKAIAPHGTNRIYMHRNKNMDHVSDSICSTHTAVHTDLAYEVQAISIQQLCKKYNPSLIKMDIEGAEYEVYKECLGIPQVLMEVHDFCIEDKTEEDSQKIIDCFKRAGYAYSRDGHNLTFIQ